MNRGRLLRIIVVTAIITVVSTASSIFPQSDLLSKNKPFELTLTPSCDYIRLEWVEIFPDASYMPCIQLRDNLFRLLEDNNTPNNYFRVLTT